MKANKGNLGVILLTVTYIISIGVCILFRSNTESLVINLLFTTLMFGILMYFMRYLRRFSSMISDLKHGKDYLESITDANSMKIYEVFPTNPQLTILLDNYYNDNPDFDGDIADYINENLLEDVIHKQTTELAISAMTGLGLLGTFVGLILGIKDLDVNQDQLMESIKTLMNGMKTAFLTSIFGVVYSLLFNAIYKDLYSDGIKALDSFYDAFYAKFESHPDSQKMNQLLDYQSKLVGSIESLPATISTAIAQEIDKVFAPTVSKMDHLMEEFVSVATSNQQESLDILVHSFVDSMNNILNDKFTMLADTLDKTCEMQTQNYEMMNSVVAATSAQLQKLSELNQSVENALEKICGYVSMIDTFNESITKYNDETHKLIDTVLESQNSTFVTVQEFAKNITDMTSYVSVVKTSIDDLKSLLESFSQNSVELMNANVLTIERTTNETARVVDALDKQVSAFTDSSGNLITEIKTVGSRIHTECNGLENSLSTSLNATFKVFDENLAEITTHLNSSIKEMQELVDRLPRDLYISIGKLKESMDQCVSLLNDNAPAKEGHES